MELVYPSPNPPLQSTERIGQLVSSKRGLTSGHMNPNAGGIGGGMGRDLSLEKRFQRKGVMTIPHRQVGQVSCGFFLNHVELRVIKEPHTMLEGCALLPRPCCHTSGTCGT